MTTSLGFPGPGDFPGPRDGLDEGSLAELAQDSRAVEVDVASPRPWAGRAFCPIDVPDDASALIDGIATYGM
jgi:hypothetical protein